MALTDVDVRAQYNGNGSNQTFAIPFAEIDGFETETKVYLDDTLQTLTSDYTISSTNVVFVTAPPSGTNNVTVIRQLSLTQPTDLLPSGAVDLEAIEAALDRVAALVQQVEEKTDRAPLLKITSAFGSLTLPEPVANNIISWNAGATDLENKTANEILALLDALIATNNLSDLTDAAAAISNLGITATAAELNYVDGVTSNIQTQLDGKEPTVNLTASRALQSGAGGGLEASTVTSTELAYLSGVSSAIQTQLDAKAPLASPDFTGEVDLTDQAQLNFFEGSGGGSNRLSMKAPATLSGDVDWILPSADGGADQFLKTDGSGNLSFDNPPSGFSNPMTTGGDIIYGSTGGAAARLANGSSGQVLTSAGGTSAPTWEDTAVPLLGIATKTTTYTATTSDDVILCDASSGAFTVTLYAASGNSGKRLKIKKTDSSYNIVTIDGNASETIDGDSAKKLTWTQEFIELVCDGSNWHVVARDWDSQLISFTSSWNGRGTLTFSYDNAWVQKLTVDTVRIKWGWRTTGGSGAASSLDIIIPNSWTVDTNKSNDLSAAMQAEGQYFWYDNSGSSTQIGDNWGPAAPSSAGTLIRFRLPWDSNLLQGSVFANADRFTGYADVPITQWAES